MRRRVQPESSPSLHNWQPMPLDQVVEQNTNPPEPHSAYSDKIKSFLSERTKNQWICFGLTFLTVLGIILATRTRSASWMHHDEVAELLQKAKANSNSEYIVFVTKSSTNNPQLKTKVQIGFSRKDATTALKQAHTRLPGNMDYNQVKIDVVTSVINAPKYNWVEDTSPTASSYFGIALDWKRGLAFLPEQVYAQTLLDSEKKLRWDHIGKVWAQANAQTLLKIPFPSIDKADEDTIVSIDFFETVSLYLDLDSGDQFSLLNGHRMFSDRDLTPSALHHSAQIAGDYLTRGVNLQNGKMVYRYKPRSDTYPDDEDYNLTRHAGTAYAMALLYKQTKDSALLEATKASLNYLQQHTRDCPLAYQPGDMAKCLVNEVYEGAKWTHLGVNSLALLAFVQYMDSTHDTDTYMELTQSLSIWIAGTQREDGSFVQDQHIETNELDETSFIRYYPGQAVFALAKLYNVANSLGFAKNNNPEVWKQVAISGLNHIVKKEVETPDEDFVNNHWMMYALAEMHAWHTSEDIIEYAVRTARIAATRQVRTTVDGEDQSLQDRKGIYKNPTTPDLSGCATATKSEGLCSVYPVMLQSKPEIAPSVLESVKLGVRYQLQTQIRPEQAMYLKNPQKIHGAFVKSILDKQTRNDFTQHNLSSILCLAKIIENKGSPINGNANGRID